ncbi:hypothetical protein [Arthrobacter monumenti]
MDSPEQAEKEAIIERIATLSREDQLRRQHEAAVSRREWPASRWEGYVNTDEKNSAQLESSLNVLQVFRLGTLRALESDLLRPDSLATHRGFVVGPCGSGAAQFLIGTCNSPWGHATAEAHLLDMLTFRDILTSHRNSMFEHCMGQVKSVLNLARGESLTNEGASRYGSDSVFAVFDIAASFASLQLSKTSAHVTASMGYSGLDAYADAKVACHCMTVKFAQFILTKSPDTEKIVSMLSEGRLSEFGISPADLTEEELRAELSKLERAISPSKTTPETRSGWMNDDGTSRFAVTSATNPATAGAAFGHRLSRTDTDDRIVRLKKFLSVLLPFAAVTLSIWAARPLLETLFTGPPFSAWVGALTLVLLEVCMAWLIYLGLVAIIDLPATAFFESAEELSKHTVMQGRRSKEFLDALRRVRPAAFKHSKNAGLPRLFTVYFDESRAMLLGKGVRPNVVAAFHWSHVSEIYAPDLDDLASMGIIPLGPKVVLAIQQDGSDLPLSFELNRARVTWTQHSYLEINPREAVLAHLQGARTLAKYQLRSSDEAGGTTQDREAFLFETAPRSPLNLTSLAGIRARRIALARALAIMVAICVAGPAMLPLFMA